MDPKVKKFLDSLRAKGLNDTQLANLATFSKSKKAWKAEANRMITDTGNRAAASMGGAITKPPTRGKANYRSQSVGPRGLRVPQRVGDRLSKNNPNSIPNEIANDVDKVGRGIKRGARAVGDFVTPSNSKRTETGFNTTADQRRREAIQRRLRNRRDNG